MCGRYVVSRAGGDLSAFFDAEEESEQLAKPSWNIAPTDQVNVLLRGRSRAPREDVAAEPVDRPTVRRLEIARWGLVPGWVKSLRGAPVLFNARIEEAADKPAFRASVAGRRAAIPASGYYEWRTAADGPKQPFYISPPDGELFLFAGLYAWWKDPQLAADDPARWVLSATILTQQATGELATIHPRAPVVLHGDLFEDWLNPDVPGGGELLATAGRKGQEAAEHLEVRPVGRAVGSVRNNHAGLIDPLPVERLGTPLNPQ